MKCLKMLTFLPLEQIWEMEKWPDNRINEKKEILAYELTALVHGQQEADKAQASARAMFGGSGEGAELPTTELTASDLTDGAIGILDVLVKTGLCSSKGDARRNVQQGGVEAGGEKVTDIARTFTAAELSGDGLVVKRGKKNFRKVVLQ
jgi:tyrosyl-tRNA synthetase